MVGLHATVKVPYISSQTRCSRRRPRRSNPASSTTRSTCGASGPSRRKPSKAATRPRSSSPRTVGYRRRLLVPPDEPWKIRLSGSDEPARDPAEFEPLAASLGLHENPAALDGDETARHHGPEVLHRHGIADDRCAARRWSHGTPKPLDWSASPWSRRQSPPYGPVSVPSRRRRRASRERHVVEGPAWRGGNRTRDPRVMRRTRRRWKGARGTKRVHQPVFGPPSRSTGSSAHPADLQGFRVLACRRSHARFRP